MRTVHAFAKSGPVVRAYQQRDLGDLDHVFELAADMWRHDHQGKDGGTCVLGAGLSVWYVGPRKRFARPRIVVHAPGQNDGSETRARAEQYLRDQGIDCRYEPGRMD